MDANQYLTFQLAGENYAIPILRVKEIITYGPLTAVPQAPAAVRGVINLRGSVVGVIDLAVKFGLPRSPLTNRTCIVIVEVGIERETTVIGVLADAVNEVIQLLSENILPAPAFGTTTRMDFLRGMGKVDTGFVLILAIEKILADVAPHPAPISALTEAASADGNVPDGS